MTANHQAADQTTIIILVTFVVVRAECLPRAQSVFMVPLMISLSIKILMDVQTVPSGTTVAGAIYYAQRRLASKSFTEDVFVCMFSTSQRSNRPWVEVSSDFACKFQKLSSDTSKQF